MISNHYGNYQGPKTQKDFQNPFMLLGSLGGHNPSLRYMSMKHCRTDENEIIRIRDGP